MNFDTIKNIFQYLKTNYWMIPLISLGTVLFLTILKILIKEIQARIHQRWIWKQEQKKLKKEAKKIEKEKLKYREYKANNHLRNEILQHRTIMFKGFPRSGKTSGAMNFAKFLVDKMLFTERKNRRYYEIMQPEFLKSRDLLQEKGLLPIYTNLTNVRDLNTGKVAMSGAEDIIFQRKKANTPCVVVLDESSDILGKDSFKEVMNEKDEKKRADNAGAKQTAKKLGHIDMWLFLTDQGGGDTVYTVRNVGYPTITYYETRRELSKTGLKIQKKLLWKNNWGLGWFVSKPKLRFAECLFPEQTRKTFFKLFLRGSKMFERQFYLNRDSIYKKINTEYITWKQLFEWKSKFYWFYYNNYQTLIYDHKEFRNEYNDKFDANGNRKTA